jgi:hypothetical protein
MKLAIMQPYLFPYIGYFQLMNAVDEFVIYDNIEFTKKGWINRNRILVDGKDDYISFPVKKDSDYLDIRERYLAEIWISERGKMLNKIKESYKKSPFFNSAFPILERIILFEESNLFSFIFNSLILIKEYIEIKTPFVISSSISIDHTLKADKKVIEICKARKATEYLNPIGGTKLYNKSDFGTHGILLNFIKSSDVQYKQFHEKFIPWLSIIDVMMFNSIEAIKENLDNYSVE